MQFIDRIDAGTQLAARLDQYKGQAVIYALPRGGVPLGSEVAKALTSPLDLILVRKIARPESPEYAIGAVAEGGEPVFNELEQANTDSRWLRAATYEQQQENKRRRRAYFPTGFEAPDTKNKVAILVDDGMATGLTMQASVLAVRRRNPKKIVVAVPVAPADSVESLRKIADEVVVLGDPADFKGFVGAHYRSFPQVEDDEVVELLRGMMKR